MDIVVATVRSPSGLLELVSRADGQAFETVERQANPDSAVARAWNALREERAPDARRLADVAVVMLESVSDGPDAIANMLAELLPHLEAARPLLTAYDASRLQALREPDPYLAYHHGQPHADLPALFTMHLLPALRGLPFRQVSDHLDLYHSLDLERNRPLLYCISRLLCLESTRQTYEWCRVVARFPAERRARFASCLLRSQGYATDPRPYSSLVFDRFSQLASRDEQFRDWTEPFVDGLARGTSADYLLSRFYLAKHYGNGHGVGTLRGDCVDFPQRAVEKIATTLGGRHALELWERCAEVAGLSQLLGEIDWSRLEPDAMRECLQPVWSGSPNMCQELRSQVRNFIGD